MKQIPETKLDKVTGGALSQKVALASDSTKA